MLKKGANQPLFFSRARCPLFCMAISTLFFLSGCHNTPPQPTLSATGYLNDSGAVRVWRKDLSNMPVTIVSNTTPYNTEESQTITTYRYLQGGLSEITRRILNASEVVEQLHFNQQKKLTFNQRVFTDRKEMIEHDVVEYLLYQAEFTLQMTTALQAGNVKLMQGKYKDGQMTNCRGENVVMKLDRPQQLWLDKRLKSVKSANLAWLKSPKGEELLLVTDRDICATEPTIGTL